MNYTIVPCASCGKKNRILTGRNPLTANRYQIRGVPTLLFFRNGNIVEQAVGALPERELRQLIHRVIG